MLFGEAEVEAVTASLGGPFDRPTLLGFQLASVRLTEVRRHSALREAWRAGVRLADHLALETVAVDHGAAPDLAEATGLTAYDASYLSLARRMGGKLVKLDRKLAAAMTR